MLLLATGDLSCCMLPVNYVLNTYYMNKYVCTHSRCASIVVHISIREALLRMLHMVRGLRAHFTHTTLSEHQASLHLFFPPSKLAQASRSLCLPRVRPLPCPSGVQRLNHSNTALGSRVAARQSDRLLPAYYETPRGNLPDVVLRG